MDELNEDKDKINSIGRLEEELYSRNERSSILHEKRHTLSPSKHGVSENWQEEKQYEDFNPKKDKTILKKLLTISGVFFVLASLTALFMTFLGFNFISSQKVDIEIHGLTVIEGGEELVLDVSVINNNRTALNDISITVEYPEGTKNPLDIFDDLLRQKESIDHIASKDNASRSFKSILYGERQSVKNIRILLEYKTQGSEAVFYKEKIYEVGIRSTPVILTVSAPREINSGQEAEINVTVASNSNKTINDVLLDVQYPLGFSPVFSEPSANFEGRIWSLGNLEPREKKEVVIKGVIQGQEKEEKVFRFATGLRDVLDEKSIGVEFVSSFETIFINSPFMSIAVDIDKKSSQGNYVVKMGSNIKGKINWQNNLPVDLNDAVLEVKLNGETISKSSVFVSHGGFYQSVTDIILWDKNTTPSMSIIRSGQKGSFEFSIPTIKPLSESVNLFKNSAINMEITMKGLRFYESKPPEIVSASIEQKIKIETDLSLSARAVYSVGPFKNSGPFPFKAETPTTFTVIWALSNNFNDTDKTLVNAHLPVYVNWVGNVTPSNAEITFNEESRIISWNAGRISSGTGFTDSPREVAFQLSFTPSIGQVNSAPILLEDPSAIGTDVFTFTEVVDKKPALTTKIATDPVYAFGLERVVR